MNQLPERCFIAHPELPHVTILIVRGILGYTPIDTLEDPGKLNEAMGVSRAEAAAMLSGSMFGYECPAADPQNYDLAGRAISHRFREAARVLDRNDSLDVALLGNAELTECVYVPAKIHRRNLHPMNPIHLRQAHTAALAQLQGAAQGLVVMPGRPLPKTGWESRCFDYERIS